ncbi:uncharacterized protein [Medicago truncatula]|uniref:uncharacterized protein n=1 Tax=Medicago truncatula TaxID=3880 RepID=UPI000D2F3423|nr:uncharacterized protein LOC112420220 [Medicago truncatula]
MGRILSFGKWVRDIPLRLKFPHLFELAVEKESSVERMGRLRWEIDGEAWDNVHDTWRWHLDPVHGYSVRESFRFITSSGDMVDKTLVDDVWHKHVPSKVSLLVWRLLRNRVPTKNNLTHRGVLPTNDTACVAGCGISETTQHLFLQCNISNELWSQHCDSVNIFGVHPFAHLVRVVTSLGFI